tara:strand:- start:1576 stop:2007 length:432 start_codon:yes stop_codon:yes gene_type:complete
VTNGNRKFSLNSHEWVDYDPLPGDVFDYTEFEGDIIGDPVYPYFDDYLTSVKYGLPVFILTARHDLKPVKKLLSKYDINNPAIHSTGTRDPQKKVDFIDITITRNGFEYVYFVDDGVKMCNAVHAYSTQQPHIKFAIERVICK